MASRLSVILPVYNAMPYLPAAVASILSQTYRDFELIIVNDGSTDGSGEYLDNCQDPRVSVLNQPNLGSAAARNLALGECNSEYAALMDADDISKPERLRAQVEYLDRHPEVVMVGTQFEFLVGETAQRAFTAPMVHEQIEARLLKGRAGMCNSSLMFRTKFAIQCGGYTAGVLGEDIEFCLRMCEQGRAANLGEILLQYRLQGSQTSMTRSKRSVREVRYAGHCATCRRKGLPVPTLERFVRNATLIERGKWLIEAWELIQYRTARINIANGKVIDGAVRMALLGIVRPFGAFERLTNELRCRTSQEPSFRVSVPK